MACGHLVVILYVNKHVMLSQSKLKIILASNTAWSLINFRLGLATALSEAGYEVILVAPEVNSSQDPQLNAFRQLDLPMARTGKNPFADFLLFLRFIKIFSREKPDLFLAFTIKPNIFGNLAANLLHLPTINNVTGLGTAFMQKTWMTRMVRLLYKTAFRTRNYVFFQNPDDRNLFFQLKLVSTNNSGLLPGSGVSLRRFSYSPRNRGSAKFRFLFIGRFLADKGLNELAEAARAILEQREDVEFALLGFEGDSNPSAISPSQLQAWGDEGLFLRLPQTKDVRDEIRNADCVVLPSYREGTPRSLLEAAAMGRPLITTDAPGCRQVVDDGENGFLCKVRSSNDLLEKMLLMLNLNESQLAKMGLCSRKKAKREFDEALVINRYTVAISASFDSNEVKRK
jgi:glycosyltransferase involved in cell wall biosynthesis